MNSSRNPYQQRSGGMSGRAMRALLLCLLLPPIGLFYMWHNNVFRFKGRVVISAFCCVEMMLLFSWGLFGLVDWHTMPDTVLPVPGNAARATPQPDDETINALSNIDEVIALDMGNDDEEISPEATPMLTQEEEMALQQEVMNTTVYSVFRGAKYYHVSTVCGNQSNGRELTVQEAIMEGMAACPNCNPPVPY